MCVMCSGLMTACGLMTTSKTSETTKRETKCQKRIHTHTHIICFGFNSQLRCCGICWLTAPYNVVQWLDHNKHFPKSTTAWWTSNSRCNCLMTRRWLMYSCLMTSNWRCEGKNCKFGTHQNEYLDATCLRSGLKAGIPHTITWLKRGLKAPKY